MATVLSSLKVINAVKQVATDSTQFRREKLCKKLDEQINLAVAVSEGNTYTVKRQRNIKDKDSGLTTTVEINKRVRRDRQSENLQKIADACQSVGIQFTWAFDTSGTKHDRDITTDHGWKIVLSRGLDVFQRFELNDAFNFANRMQQHRQCKEFNLTYVKQ